MIQLLYTMKTLNTTVKYLLLAMSFAFAIYVIAIENSFDVRWGSVFSAFLLVFLLDGFTFATRIKIPPRLKLIWYVFLFFAFFLGIAARFYELVPHYDKVLHLMSSFVAMSFAALILDHGKDRLSTPLRIVFLITFAIAIAALWEIFEFASDKIFGTSMQELIQHGLDDTMWDMIAATVGAIIAVPLFIKKTKWVETT